MDQDDSILQISDNDFKLILNNKKTYEQVRLEARKYSDDNTSPEFRRMI